MPDLKERLRSDGAGWQAGDTLTRNGAEVINALYAEALARIEALEAGLRHVLPTLKRFSSCGHEYQAAYDHARQLLSQPHTSGEQG